MSLEASHGLAWLEVRGIKAIVGQPGPVHSVRPSERHPVM